ncbi:GTPase RsgA, partial [Actinomadura bangladeshensis]|nr:GTPase RsgA [Actinomadura bangladeshensis]
MSSAFAGPSPLADYGWDEALEEQFTSHRAAGLVPARVAAVDRGLCDVVTEDGPARASTGAASADPPAAPCTGDWAALRPD